MHRETSVNVQPSATNPTPRRREPGSEPKVTPADHRIRLQAGTRAQPVLGSQPGGAGGPAPQRSAPIYTDAGRKAMWEQPRDDPSAGHNRHATFPQWDTTADTILARLVQIRRTYELAHQAQYMSTPPWQQLFISPVPPRKLVYII